MIALDLFAGTGWGVACQKLDIEEYGVEIMPEAVATRDANGMHTIYRDVWEGLADELIESRDGYGREAADAMAARGASFREIYEILIASPPCQTFSMAGGGKGREALDEVIGLIEAKAYRDVDALRAFGEKHDPRTALVLTPLAHVYRDVPTYVVFEQVPPVLPVWERCAEEMRRWGYSVVTGILNAEQYGVPQTRRRAILIARADGIEARMPTPTHSRYYSRDPKKLDDGVEPWVSMSEALGWGMTERPFVTAGNAVGRAEGIGGSGGKAAVQREKDRGAWMQSNQNTSTTGERYERLGDLPAPTMTAGSRSNRVMRSNYSAGGSGTAEERGRTMREDDKPSLVMTGKPGHWVRPSFTVTGGGTGTTGGAEPFGSRARASMPEGASRITVEEAAALQSYPPGFTFTGTKTKQFLQIGNAVPPLLAEAILKGFLP